MKKINCKHGLDRKQEIEARRFKNVIIGKTTEREDLLNKRLSRMFEEFIQTKNDSWYNYIKVNDIVIYSAFERAGGLEKLYQFMEKHNIL